MQACMKSHSTHSVPGSSLCMLQSSVLGTATLMQAGCPNCKANKQLHGSPKFRRNEIYHQLHRSQLPIHFSTKNGCHIPKELGKERSLPTQKHKQARLNASQPPAYCARYELSERIHTPPQTHGRIVHRRHTVRTGSSTGNRPFTSLGYVPFASSVCTQQSDHFVHRSFTLRPADGYAHGACQSITACANGHYATHRPTRTGSIVFDDKYHVVLAEVVARRRPLPTLLQRRQEVGPPSRPEFVGQVLDTAPPSPAVQVRPPELSRRWQHHFWL